MARLIVYMTDRVQDDPYRDVLCYKRGDVIEVLKDGQSPGVAIEADPRFKIVDVPDMSETEARSWMTPEPGYYDDDKPENSMLRRRAFRFDIENAPAELRTRIEDASSREVVSVAALDIRSLKLTKPAINDPNTLGDDGVKVLG